MNSAQSKIKCNSQPGKFGTLHKRLVFNQGLWLGYSKHLEGKMKGGSHSHGHVSAGEGPEKEHLLKLCVIHAPLPHPYPTVCKLCLESEACFLGRNASAYRPIELHIEPTFSRILKKLRGYISSFGTGVWKHQRLQRTLGFWRLAQLTTQTLYTLLSPTMIIQGQIHTSSKV